MKFGVHLPTFWADYGTSNVRTAIVETAQAAEALGYAGVWDNDTVVVSPDHAWTGHVIEPLITLASLVHLIPHLKLGTSVLVVPQRNIFLVAKQVAALDVFSEGRMILGIGVGWREDEFSFMKADFEHRHAMTDEAIEALRVLWRDQVASFPSQREPVLVPAFRGDGPEALEVRHQVQGREEERPGLPGRLGDRDEIEVRPVLRKGPAHSGKAGPATGGGGKQLRSYHRKDLYSPSGQSPSETVTFHAVISPN